MIKSLFYSVDRLMPWVLPAVVKPLKDSLTFASRAMAKKTLENEHERIF